MKHIVQYKLHGGTIPYFIEDGGHFYNNGKMIGLTKDDVTCYVPPSSELITFTTKDAFIGYIITLTIMAPMIPGTQNDTALTNDEKTTLASDFWDARQ